MVCTLTRQVPKILRWLRIEPQQDGANPFLSAPPTSRRAPPPPQGGPDGQGCADPRGGDTLHAGLLENRPPPDVMREGHL